MHTPSTQGCPPFAAGTNVQQVVCRLHDVLGILCRRHGPYELRLSSPLAPEIALHRGLLWLHHHDPCLCYQG